jgi:DNA-binding transcriptional regulator YiaG
MTGAEFKAARVAMGLTREQLAEALESDFRTIRRWENEERAIPGPARVALRLMLQASPKQSAR